MKRPFTPMAAGARRARLPSAASQRGSIASFMVLAMGGALLATAYVLDTSRMVSNAAQVKRATDAAAMAVGNERLINGENSMPKLSALAYDYVKNNLGMDSQLAEQIDYSNFELSKTVDDESRVRYRAEVSFHADPELLGGKRQDLNVHSTVEVISRATEIALMLPNTGSENDAQLAALRRLGKNFITSLLGEDSSSNDNKRLWISLVPYSQAVNVYDPADAQRIRRWATSQAINAVELQSLFRTGKISSLADRRTPDLASGLTCMNRGLVLGENYFWDEPPTGQFTRVYYRHDLIENDPGARWVSWVGPNPDFGLANGISDTRFIVADKGCPKAALLPLTNDKEELEKRLDAMRTGFNVNYSIAMGWAGMALSPQMRGSNGWLDPELPLDFNEGDGSENVKIIVMLANTVGDWFDTDSYNAAKVGQSVSGENNGTDYAMRRFESLCSSFRARKLKFYFIGVRPGDPADSQRVLFDKIAGPGLQICAQGGGDMVFADASTFVQGEDQIQTLLNKIANKIKHEHYARLVE
ncbi:Tad domain-containing protein [Pseudomonas viridiflava]|uniref:Tad domain-containing protein n=1 Tax=Pseudomonas viridiflava TaxID=33069 RepID=UPI0019687BC5|nr:Tad domain-containing protein [Pseudomonas viridiflava]